MGIIPGFYEIPQPDFRRFEIRSTVPIDYIYAIIRKIGTDSPLCGFESPTVTHIELDMNYATEENEYVVIGYDIVVEKAYYTASAFTLQNLHIINLIPMPSD